MSHVNLLSAPDYSLFVPTINCNNILNESIRAVWDFDILSSKPTVSE